MATKIAYAIARESSDDKTLENQYKKLEEKAEKEGYKIVKQFGENISGDVSKVDYNDPPHIIKLREAIKERKPDAIFVTALDRLTRTTFRQGSYIDEFSVRPRIPMYFLREEHWTIDPETGIVDENFINEQAKNPNPQGERESIVARTKTRREEVGMQGYFIGHLSDGYKVKESWGTYEDGRRRKIKEIIVDEERKTLIEYIFKLFLDGFSTDDIAEKLNGDDRYPTTNNYRSEHPELFGYKKHYKTRGGEERSRNQAKWCGSHVSRILTNEWYIGKREYKETPLTHEAIISIEDWNKVEALIEERKKTFRSKRTSTKHIYALQNILFCGKCASKMYGHYTGANNHYYCSSLENGGKCGLRGICKENIEAIIYHRIINRAFNAEIKNESDPCLDFFKMDKKEEQKIKDSIKDKEKSIKIFEKENEKQGRKINKYIDLQGECDDKTLEKYYVDAIRKCRDEQESNKNKIIKYRTEIINEKRLLSSNSNIQKVLFEIMTNKDIKTIKRLFNQVIERVILFNTEKENDIIRIIYINGKKEECIYSHKLLQYKYIPIYEPLYYDETQNLLCSTNYPITITRGGMHIYADKEEDYKEPEILDFYDENTEIEDKHLPSTNTNVSILDLVGDKKEYEKGLTVDEYIHWVRDSERPIHYERVEEESPLSKEQKAHYKEMRKKNNSGKPTLEPWVIRNKDYDSINKERKKIYNKRDKIKRNKSKSDSQKKKELQETKMQLDILNAQVPFIKEKKPRFKKRLKEENAIRLFSSPIEETE